MQEIQQVSMAILGWKPSNALQLQRLLLFRPALKPCPTLGMLVIALHQTEPHVLQTQDVLPPKASLPPTTATLTYVLE